MSVTFCSPRKSACITSSAKAIYQRLGSTIASMTTDAVTRNQQLQRGILLEYLTLAWNIVEGTIAIASGAVSGSIALVGFGIDSFIETSSGGILLWRLRAEHHGHDAEQVERKALKLVGVSFM